MKMPSFIHGIVDHCDACDTPKDVPIEIQIHEINQRIDCLFISLKGVETKLMEMKSQPIPHKCPVCDGLGIIATGLRIEEVYGTNLKTCKECPACQKKGIVWIGLTTEVQF